jgi:hypothetical protein
VSKEPPETIAATYPIAVVRVRSEYETKTIFDLRSAVAALIRKHKIPINTIFKESELQMYIALIAVPALAPNRSKSLGPAKSLFKEIRNIRFMAFFQDARTESRTDEAAEAAAFELLKKWYKQIGKYYLGAHELPTLEAMRQERERRRSQTTKRDEKIDPMVKRYVEFLCTTDVPPVIRSNPTTLPTPLIQLINHMELVKDVATVLQRN